MTATRYRPLDTTYPTNYPASNDIPIPSGLLKDLGTNSLRILESNIKGTRQGWAYSMARTNLASSGSTLTPANSLDGFTGYRNPTTTADTFDRSTIGLQVSGQIASNQQMEPIVLAVPFAFSSMSKKSIRVGITGELFADNAIAAGGHISVGYIAWDDGGRYYENLPSDFANACDPDQDPQNIIFNINPNFLDTASTRYFDPSTTTSTNFRYFELEIPYRKLELLPSEANGFILISLINWPSADPIGVNFQRPTDWDWLIFDGVVDPNHLVLNNSNFRYRTYFTFNTVGPPAGVGETGGKHLRIPSNSDCPVGLMYKITAPNTVTSTPDSFSYHSLLQFRAEGDSQKGFTPNKSANMIYPFIPTDWLSQDSIYGQNNWRLDLHTMSSWNISSIFIDELPFDSTGNNTYTDDVDDYRNPSTTTGAEGSASTYNNRVNVPNVNLLQSAYAASNCNARVKGGNTDGVLTGIAVLEKNEAFCWNYFDSTITYGGQPVGTAFSLNYSTVNFEGWNAGLGYLWVESTTPDRRVISGPDPFYRIDCQLAGDAQAIDLLIQYPLSAGKTGSRGYSARLDRSIAYLPFNPFFAPETQAQGVTPEQYVKAGSFNTPGMLDRLFNNNVLQDYRLVFDLYPLTEALATDFERASGVTNNYITGGGVAFDTITTVWPRDPPVSRIQFLGELYGPTEVKDRGVVTINNVNLEDPAVISLPEGSIYVVYGASYQSKFTQDPT